MNTQLEKGDPITLFWINQMAFTSKIEVIFLFEDEEKIVYKKTKRYRENFSRKKNTINLALPGHNLHIGADSDDGIGCFRGNAFLNLVNDEGACNTQDVINEYALWPIIQADYFMSMTKEEADNSEYELKQHNCVYPEVQASNMRIESIRETVKLD